MFHEPSEGRDLSLKKKIIKIGEAVAAGGTGEENLLSFYMCIDGF